MPLLQHPRLEPFRHAATGAERVRFEGHTREVFAVAFSPDGASVVSGGEESAAGESVWSCQHNAEYFGDAEFCMFDNQYDMGNNSRLLCVTIVSSWISSDMGRTPPDIPIPSRLERHRAAGVNRDRIACPAHPRTRLSRQLT